MHRVQLTGNAQQPQLKFVEEKIIHRKTHRLSLFFLSLKEPIAFWNNMLFAFHFSKELRVTIVTGNIYNSCLQEDSRGNSFIRRSCYEHPYDSRVDIDLCLPVIQTLPCLWSISKFFKEKGPDCPQYFKAPKLHAYMGTLVISGSFFNGTRGISRWWYWC